MHRTIIPNKYCHCFLQQIILLPKAINTPPKSAINLISVIRNIVVLHNNREVHSSHLPPPLDQALGEQTLPQLVTNQSQSNDQPGTEQPIRPLATVERETIEQAIEVCRGNIPKAAGLLDVSPSTIYRKKQAWEGI